MGPDALAAALIALGYLSGSVPYGALIARAKGVEIQKVGSGNIGATNVARSVGKGLGAVVLVLDALKGALPVALSRALLGEASMVTGAVALAAVLGHCFPVWLRFSGGKGVATSLGVFLVLDPIAAAVSAGIFATVYAAFRKASLGSLVATLAFPALLGWRGRPPQLIALALATALVIVVQHRSNIRRLIRREEHGV